MVSSLKIERLKKGFKQDEIAEKVGISQARYNYYENGTQVVPDDIAEKISDVLSLSINDIFLPKKFTVRYIQN